MPRDTPAWLETGITVGLFMGKVALVALLLWAFLVVVML